MKLHRSVCCFPEKDTAVLLYSFFIDDDEIAHNDASKS